MFKISFKEYRNDYDNKNFEKLFDSLEQLKHYLKEENNKRDDTPRYSQYWRNPCGVNSTSKRGWFRTGRTASTYSLWLKKVEYNGIVVFEENNYCSEKFYKFLQELEQELEQKPVYGDF